MNPDSTQAAASSPTTTPLIASPSARNSRLVLLAHCLFFAALMYVAHFWYSKHFGLYEDDFYIIPSAATWTFPQVLHFIKEHVIHYTQGRPVGWTFWLLIPYIGFKLGGLPAVYALSSLIVLANGALFYLLVRCAFTESLAILAALTYCLFPAYTVHQMLVYTDISDLSILFLLISMHCYLSKRYIPAYLIAALTLLTYESAYLPFLFVPLLRPKWQPKLLRSLLIHWTLCGATLSAAVAVRLAVGEYRIVETSAQAHSLPYRIATSLYIGPLTSISQFYHRAIFTFAHTNEPHITPAILIGLAAFTLFLACSSIFRRPTSPTQIQFADLLRPLLIGATMLITAYAFAFTNDHYPPDATFGHSTSVHLAATIGGSILFAAACQFILILAGLLRLRHLAALLFAAYFAVLFGFAFIVQNGFVSAHDHQRQYWTRIIELCPDLDDGTIILLERPPDNTDWFAIPTTWSDPLVLPYLFQFPLSFRHPPMLVPVPDDRSWTWMLTPQGDHLIWTEPFPGAVGPQPGDPLPEHQTILLQETGNTITRLTGELEIQGQSFLLKPPPHPQTPTPYPPGALYQLLINPSQLPRDITR